MFEFIFYFSILLIFYVYGGYPLAVFCLSIFKQNKRHENHFEPTISILIAAYNEETGIEQTILNKLDLSYPKNKLEIIVISDESTDNTDAIVKQYESKNVRLIRQIPRAGKTSALNRAVNDAKGEILVFSDANSIYSKDALAKLVRNFSDPEVGYVTGKMIYTNENGSVIGDGCSAYMKYENYLRRLETKIGSVVGVDGGIDAIRKKLYQHMNPDQLPDFVLPLKVIEQGYKVVYEPDALLKEQSLNTSSDEYRMRVRVSLRALWALYDMRRLLWHKNYLFSWQLWSHKVLRYLCFIFLVLALVSNFVLSFSNPFFTGVFVLQLLFYTSVFVFHALQKKGIQSKILYFSYYFVLLNIASASATIKFLFRQKMVIWTPRKG